MKIQKLVDGDNLDGMKITTIIKSVDAMIGEGLDTTVNIIFFENGQVGIIVNKWAIFGHAVNYGDILIDFQEFYLVSDCPDLHERLIAYDENDEYTTFCQVGDIFIGRLSYLDNFS